MYKIANIIDLSSSPVFMTTDKVIELSNDRTKMRVGDNDYEHKNKTYLSSCIDIADSAMNSYITAIEEVESIYLTDNISSVYYRNKDLIPQRTLDTLITSNAYLTKDGCKELETECIRYINELKNKAVSLIVGQMNKSFVYQNSVQRIVFGQSETKDGAAIHMTSEIVNEDKGNDGTGYDFINGKFTLSQMLGVENFDRPPDLWQNYNENDKTFYEGVNSTNVEDFISKLPDAVVFNPTVGDSEINSKNCCINVPHCSYDFKKNQSIPIALLVKYYLKQQIYKCITMVCNNYMSEMTSIPITGDINFA